MSSGSSQGSAEVREPGASDEPGQPREHEPAITASQANFGANEWLVEELYQQYLVDRSSVDRAWWSFFDDYTPALPNGTGPQPILTTPARAPQPAPVPQVSQPAAQVAPARSPHPCRRRHLPR